MIFPKWKNTWYHSGSEGVLGTIKSVAVLPTNNGANGNSGFTLQFVIRKQFKNMKLILLNPLT